MIDPLWKIKVIKKRELEPGMRRSGIGKRYPVDNP
jgi:hypothetical protein